MNFLSKAEEQDFKPIRLKCLFLVDDVVQSVIQKSANPSRHCGRFQLGNSAPGIRIVSILNYERDNSTAAVELTTMVPAASSKEIHSKQLRKLAMCRGALSLISMQPIAGRHFANAPCRAKSTPGSG